MREIIPTKMQNFIGKENIEFLEPRILSITDSLLSKNWEKSSGESQLSMMH